MTDYTQVQIQIETQLAQIPEQIEALHKSGQFSSDTIVNPKNHCNVIHFGSGTQYRGP